MNPQESAITSMWTKRIEFKILEPVGSAFRNRPMAGFFKDGPGTIHPSNVKGEEKWHCWHEMVGARITRWEIVLIGDRFLWQILGCTAYYHFT